MAGRHVMIVNSFTAPALTLCVGLALGSCASVSGGIADHWPHWAGGLPSDVPPRPGAPGYDEFIAHQRPMSDANPAATAAASNQTPAASVSKPNLPAASTGARPQGDTQGGTNVGQGGLY
jgi:hypothetical protein